MKFKNRCYEQVRVAYKGMGCEWTHGYYQTDESARQHLRPYGNRFDHDDPNYDLNRRRDPEDNPDMWDASEGEGKGFPFERGAERHNAWHRKRTEGCAIPEEDDEQWVE